MSLELADILQKYGEAYQHKYGKKLLPSQRQAMQAIQRCRTEALGGHVYACRQCGEEQYSYHSCRNRHCPKCQHERTEAWLAEQTEMLLPVPYYMLTFTLPSGLRAFARGNQKLCYNLMFRLAVQASQSLAKDPRYGGGQLGMIGILHTWTRNLIYHPHIHFLVPAGVVTAKGVWRGDGGKFLLPVKAVSKIWRGKFRDALRKADLLEQVPKQVWQQQWVVHCKAVGDGNAVLKYLAPYVYRIAISNRRLVRLDDYGDLSTSQVTFQYRPAESRQYQECTLSVEAFLQRFLQHVLPKGFVKVRYYGFLGSAKRKQLQALRQELQQTIPKKELAEGTDPAQPTAPEPPKTHRCPKCGQAMTLLRTLAANRCRSP
jgi:hypothetical protein